MDGWIDRKCKEPGLKSLGQRRLKALPIGYRVDVIAIAFHQSQFHLSEMQQNRQRSIDFRIGCMLEWRGIVVRHNRHGENLE